MTRTIIYRADVIVTMDSDRRELRGGAVVIRDNAIEWIGPTADLEPVQLANAQRC